MNEKISDADDSSLQGRTALEVEGAEYQEIPARGVPWITYAVIAVCAVICAYFNLFEESSSYDNVTTTLAPSAIAIWSGAYWAFLTSAFVHIEIWHILFNMWWAKDFGTLLEPTMGRGRYLLFITSSAVISSGAQLIISDQTGIGFSGVVYAMFGYTLAARHVEPLYRHIMSKETIRWLLGWLVLCIVLTAADVWNVGNAAHAAGFLFGYFVGNAFVARSFVAASRLGLAILALVTVFAAGYMPWSETWRSRDDIAAYFAVVEAAEDGDPEAQYTYALYMQAGEQKAESVVWLRKSAEQGYVSAMNQLAWMLATDSDDDFRDGAEAVKWAKQACEANGWEDASHIDTLAAAFAEMERWDEAVATQRMAISKLTDEDEESGASWESRLEKYLRREKFRE